MSQEILFQGILIISMEGITFTHYIILEIHNSLALRFLAELNEGAAFLLYSVVICAKKNSNRSLCGSMLTTVCRRETQR